MKTETQMWIEKLEGAATANERLPQMSAHDRRQIHLLLHNAGRHDLALAAYRLIPIDWSKARRASLHDLALEEARRKLH